jgi:16S rRNA (adenine1518-N6/adenine1519-N6)-dimethyltransferase
LHDIRVAERIATLATTPTGGCTLEIGAGMGALTEHLATRAARVVAVERDRDLVPYLEAKFRQTAHVHIREADAAQLDWLAELSAGPSPRIVAGNLPYAITGRLIRRAVQIAQHVDRAVFMVQREVADRLAAEPGSKNYGMSSVFTQAAFEVKLELKVSSGAFHPAPKVDSSVVVLLPHAVPRAEETPRFASLVRSAFAMRRKTLRNAWKTVLPRESLDEAALAADVDLSARAETLHVEAFARMASQVDQLSDAPSED